MISNTKKHLCLLLALCLALGLLSGCGGQAAAAVEEAEALPGELDEAAWLELTHKLYEANQLDALLRRHSSLQYTFSYPETPEKDNYYWETAEAYYQEWPGYNYARYDCDRVYYVMQLDETGAPTLTCGVDLSAEYDPFFELFGLSEEEEFCDSEHERLVGSFIEDGLLHVLTEYDESASQEWVEDTLERDWEGEAVRMEAVIDPETNEFLRNSFTMEKDGETWAAYGYAAAFDAPEPLGCQMLRASFERTNAWPMDVNVVLDQGTDHELAKSFTVAQNSDVEFSTDAPYILFGNAEYTSVAPWDCKSDYTCYLVTDPDQPLIDRYSALATEAMIERGTAADLDSVTVEALIAANLPEAIFENHQTMFVTTHDRFDGDWCFTCAPGLYFESNYAGWNNLLDGDGNWFLEEGDDGERAFSRSWFAISDEEREAMEVRPEDLSCAVNPDTTATETLTDVTDNENGTLTVTTRMNAEDTRAGLEAKGVEITEEYLDAEKEIVYLVAADTLEILSFTEYFVTGEERSLCNITAVCYDAELPETVAEIQAMKEDYLAGGAEDVKTITVTYDPGTAAEETFSITAPRDMRVDSYFRDGYGELYSDPEQTVLFDGTPDADGNYQIYLFAAE